MNVHNRSDLIYALECAADFLDGEEWAEPADKQSVEAAYKQAAKMIRELADMEQKKKEKT